MESLNCDSTAHVCKQIVNEKSPGRPIMAIEKPQNGQFSIDTIEVQRQMIDTIHELAYAINTQMISSLAITQGERQRVIERIQKQDYGN